MIQRIGRRKYKVFAFDIESHNDPISIKKKETSMWLGCLLDEESKPQDSSCYFYNMNSFLKHLMDLSSLTRKSANENRPIKNLCIYIFNLSFEWSFILPVMLQDFGFQFKEKIEDEDEFVFNTVSTKSVSSVWLVQMKFHKNSGLIIFRDLAKIFGGKLSTVSKAFGLQTQKGSINYRKYRLQLNYRPSAKELYYCYCDVRIIVEILMKMKDDCDFWNVSSMASYSMKKLLKCGWPRSLKPYKEYRMLYPVLDKEQSEFLRKGVSGGITYAPSRWQFKDIKQNILHIDKRQMYPSSAYYNLFPYGDGIYFEGKPPALIKTISCCRIRITYDSVKLHSVIGLIGLDMITDKEITVWDFEIPTMYKVYVNLQIEYIDGYCYHAKPIKWRKYYANNYNLRLEAKKRKDDFYILYYKLLNNSSYGKLLEKAHNQIFANTIDKDGIIDSIIIDKDLFSQEVGSKYTYLPLGSCIPAYSRVDLIESALKFNWKDVVYFDTDSIFVLATEENMKVWNTQFNHIDFLGGWGFEEMIKQAQFTAPKRYKLLVDVEDKEGKIHEETIVKMAGINGIHDVPYDEINIINSKWQVQRAFRCKGGTLIDFQNKEVSVQEKYKPIYIKNKDMI